MGKQEMRHLRAHRPAAAPKPPLATRALRYLCGFLALMVLFTLLSRAADEMTIPRVRLSLAEGGTIDRTITGYGTVEALSAQPVTAQPGIRVAGVSVKPGSRVTEGEPLFTLDAADLQDKLTAARETLDRLDMDLSDWDSRSGLAADERARALERANEDYSAAQASAQRTVDQASQDLERAKAKLAAAVPPSGDLASLEADCAQKAADLKAAEDELARLEALTSPDGMEASPGPDDTPAPPPDGLEEARGRVEEARAAKEQADSALAAYRDSAAEYQLLQEGVASAQRSYDMALEARDNALRAASRQIEDAARPQAQDSSREKAQLDRDRQAQQVETLEQLLESGGIVRAPAAGTVAGVSVTVGSPTPDGTALLLSGAENGSVFTAQLDLSQEKYISPGDQVVLKPGGSGRDIDGLTVAAVARSSTPGLLDVTVALPEGTLDVGSSAQLEIKRQSQPYQCRVPLSALHEENGRFFLLVVREKAGLLGTESTAARLDVEVLEKNESYAAIQPGALERRQGFIDYAAKPVSAGDRIRLEVQ